MRTPPAKPSPTALDCGELDRALAHIDWGQVIANGGPPCFHLEGGKFCLRAERWPGHQGFHHAYVSLADLFATLAKTRGETE